MSEDLLRVWKEEGQVGGGSQERWGILERWGDHKEIYIHHAMEFGLNTVNERAFAEFKAGE